VRCNVPFSSSDAGVVRGIAPSVMSRTRIGPLTLRRKSASSSVNHDAGVPTGLSYLPPISHCIVGKYPRGSFTSAVLDEVETVRRTDRPRTLRDGMVATVTRGMRTAAVGTGCLSVAGFVVILWYVKWGVHGCSNVGAARTCEQRMARDFAIYLLGIGALLVGMAVVGTVIVRSRRA
jgi:hypothetical protein